MLNVELNGIVAEDCIRIAPRISVSSEAIDFTKQPLVDGPIISALGMVTAIGIATILLTEQLVKAARHGHQ